MKKDIPWVRLLKHQIAPEATLKAIQKPRRAYASKSPLNGREFISKWQCQGQRRNEQDQELHCQTGSSTVPAHPMGLELLTAVQVFHSLTYQMRIFVLLTLFSLQYCTQSMRGVGQITCHFFYKPFNPEFNQP
jgi:hypothetical protein